MREKPFSLVSKFSYKICTLFDRRFESVLIREIAMTQYDQGLGGYYEKFRFILVSICNLKNNFNLRDLFIFNVLDLNFLFIESRFDNGSMQNNSYHVHLYLNRTIGKQTAFVFLMNLLLSTVHE